MEKDKTENSVADQLIQIFAGGTSGAITRCFCQPLDVIKIRFQLQVEPLKKGYTESKYRSIPQAVKLMYREEGIFSFWKGHNPAQLLSITFGITQFWVFEQLNSWTKHVELLHDSPTARHFISGAVAGSAATFVSAPLDVVRTRLVAQDKTKGYRNSIQGLGSIYRHEGIKGLFRGLGPSIVQVAPLSGIQFMFFNIICNTLKKIYNIEPEEKLSVIDLLVAGCLAGVGSKTITYPLDLAKKRLQIQGFSKHRQTFGKHFICRNMYSCLKNTVVIEGFKGLFKGLKPTILKAGVTTALHFCIYDEVVLLLH